MEKLFSRGLSYGKGFCNRVNEKKQLQLNIDNNTHSLIISPRRYGKTSLVLNVISQNKLPFTHIDLFMKYSLGQIEDAFYEGVSSLLARLTKPTEKAMQALQKIFSNMKISLSLGDAGFEFSLKPTEKKQESLKLLLENLDEYLIKKNKKVILFIDEFQSVTISSKRDSIEAMLRFVAQKTRNIVFIFSGSNRHLLDQIFNDVNRPFYKLCHQMHLDKIEKSHYIKHLAGLSSKKWGSALSADALENLIEYARCHPYYVNVLCEKLFQQGKLPNNKDVLSAWQQVCLEEQSAVGRDMEFLTSKQKQLLVRFARTPGVKEPTAKQFVNKVDITPKGILDGMVVLVKYDLIERTQNGAIYVIDPVIEYWAKEWG